LPINTKQAYRKGTGPSVTRKTPQFLLTPKLICVKVKLGRGREEKGKGWEETYPTIRKHIQIICNPYPLLNLPNYCRHLWVSHSKARTQIKGAENTSTIPNEIFRP
jgi:hypothetical protein